MERGRTCMGETASAPDSDPDLRGADDVPSCTETSSTSDSTAFAQTRGELAVLGRAFLKFGHALQRDLSVTLGPAAKRLHERGGQAVQRLRDLGVSTAKLKAIVLAEHWKAA